MLGLTHNIIWKRFQVSHFGDVVVRDRKPAYLVQEVDLVLQVVDGVDDGHLEDQLLQLIGGLWRENLEYFGTYLGTNECLSPIGLAFGVSLTLMISHWRKA